MLVIPGLSEEEEKRVGVSIQLLGDCLSSCTRGSVDLWTSKPADVDPEGEAITGSATFYVLKFFRESGLRVRTRIEDGELTIYSVWGHPE